MKTVWAKDGRREQQQIVNRNTRTSVGNQYQSGSSMVEFLIVVPFLLWLGMGILQFGLVYHAKSMLNYATFEAARAGALHNAQSSAMRSELGYRLAAVFGGSGSLRDGVNAIVRSKVIANDPTATKIEILNPGKSTYAVHGVKKSVVTHSGSQKDVIAIPNSHLRLRDHSAIAVDGLNIQDANLLKIRVTYGYQMRLPFLDMEVPGMRLAMRAVMLRADPDNWMYYLRGMLPIQTTATVRMQSEAWQEQAAPANVKMFDAMYNWTLAQLDPPGNKDNITASEPTATCDENGLVANSPIEVLSLDSCVAVPDIPRVNYVNFLDNRCA